MKKVLAAVVALVAVSVLVNWIGARAIYRRLAHDAWPANLGTLDEVPARYPPSGASPAAKELMVLSGQAGIAMLPGHRSDLHRPNPLWEAYADYIRAQIERSGDAIDAPPPVVAEHLAKTDAHLVAIRDHLLRGGTLEWDRDITRRDGPIPDLQGHLRLQRVLVARALARARAGDAGAWDELHASWVLARALWHRPEVPTAMIALSVTRMMNAAARKMPARQEPRWFAETRSFDSTRAMMAVHQADAWRQLHAIDNSGIGRSNAAIRWYLRDDAMQDARRIREYLAAVHRSRACDVLSVSAKTRDVEQVAGIYERVLRFRAEIEATEKILQLRRGEAPSSQSQCSDGKWIVSAEALRFNRNIAAVKPSHRIPLEYAKQQ